MNRPTPYNDIELRRLSALAADWLEGFTDSGSTEAREDSYASLLRLAHDIEMDKELSSRLDKETLSTLRLIALINKGGASMLEDIAMPEEIDLRLSRHIHNLAEADGKEERKRKGFMLKAGRWGAAAAVAILLFAGGYKLLDGSVSNHGNETPLIAQTMEKTDKSNFSAFDSDNNSTIKKGEPHIAPEKETYGEQITSTYGKTPSKNRLRKPKTQSSKTTVPELSEEEALEVEIAQERLLLLNDICESNGEANADKVKETLGMVAMQTNVMTQSINDNLASVDNILRSLQNSLLTTQESLEQASMVSSAVSLGKPSREILNRSKAIPASPQPRDPNDF